MNGKTFNCSEQFFQYSKANFFNDSVAVDKILSTENPAEQKKTKVRGFKPREWNKVCYQMMKEGIRAKFSSNITLKKYLIATGNKQLIEASPYDSYWGIGCGMYSQRVNQKSLWGHNYLGKALMEIREELK